LDDINNNKPCAIPYEVPKMPSSIQNHRISPRVGVANSFVIRVTSINLYTIRVNNIITGLRDMAAKMNGTIVFMFVM